MCCSMKQISLVEKIRKRIKNSVCSIVFKSSIQKKLNIQEAAVEIDQDTDSGRENLQDSCLETD